MFEKNFKEISFIKFLKKYFPAIGDDCFFYKNLAISTDTFIEETHFTKTILSPEDIGYRCMAAALSDLAAVAAKPLFALVSLGAPVLEKKWIKKLYRGLSTHQVEIAGGDTVKSEKIILNITVIGKVKKPLKRKGARPGNLVYITGPTGMAWAGLISLQRGLKLKDCEKKFKRPVPKFEEAWRIRKKATACIDISDGLVHEAQLIAAESRVDIHIETSRLFIHPELKSDALKAFGSPLRFVLHGGEDFELLYTGPEGLPGTVIGKVTKGKGRVFLDGEQIHHEGWEHF